ncbi:MAG: hypothetical protein AAF358_26080, partial [Pseudomonadota bacterium]
MADNRLMWRLILLILAVVMAGPVRSELVPLDFAVPKTLEHSKFRLEPLTQIYAEADYEAVMASGSELRQLFGGDWPSPDFTLDANRQDIATHEEQASARKAFTYTVLAPAGESVEGCVYVIPAEDPGFDVAVFYWTRTDGALADAELAEVLSVWFQDVWP